MVVKYTLWKDCFGYKKSPHFRESLILQPFSTFFIVLTYGRIVLYPLSVCNCEDYFFFITISIILYSEPLPEQNISILRVLASTMV